MSIKKTGAIAGLAAGVLIFLQGTLGLAGEAPATRRATSGPAATQPSKMGVGSGELMGKLSSSSRDERIAVADEIRKLGRAADQDKAVSLLTAAVKKATGEELLALGGALWRLDPRKAKVLGLDRVTVSLGETDLKMAWIPGGEFWMGCSRGDGDCLDDEKPRHRVWVDGFWMGQYEVTQGQWIAVTGKNVAAFHGCDECPVEMISWKRTHDFLKKSGLGLRLPTDAQWEYAARGGVDAARYGVLDEIAWHGKLVAGKRPQSVGSKKPNAFGLYDMLGNVYEWCEDGYKSDSYQSRKGLTRNPFVRGYGPEYRSLRGGSWRDYPEKVRVSFRGWFLPDGKAGFTGFRVVR